MEFDFQIKFRTLGLSVDFETVLPDLKPGLKLIELKHVSDFESFLNSLNAFFTITMKTYAQGSALTVGRNFMFKLNFSLGKKIDAWLSPWIDKLIGESIRIICVISLWPLPILFGCYAAQ